MNTLRTVTVTRYMQHLREGGSFPALAEADDGFKYIVKFKPPFVQLQFYKISKKPLASLDSFSELRKAAAMLTYHCHQL